MVEKSNDIIDLNVIRKVVEISDVMLFPLYLKEVTGVYPFNYLKEWFLCIKWFGKLCMQMSTWNYWTNMRLL